MADEYFFGITLDAGKKEYKWEPDALKENGDVSLTQQGEHCLVLKQALLIKGKSGELNVVQVNASGYKELVEIPIIALEAGKQTHVNLDLTFPDTHVVFKLIEGSGPIHITGVHAVQTEQFVDGYQSDEDDEEADEIEEEEDEEEEVVEAEPKGKGKGKKRTNSNSNPVPSKKKKNSKESS